MKKKLIFISVLCILLLGCSLPVAAATTKKAVPGKPALTGNLAERLEFIDLRIEILEIRRQNILLTDENRKLRQELLAILEANRDSLDPATVEPLKVLRDQTRDLVQALKDTRGDITAILREMKPLLKQRDWPALLDACHSIIGIEQSRQANLQEINQLLRQMLDLLS